MKRIARTTGVSQSLSVAGDRVRPCRRLTNLTQFTSFPQTVDARCTHCPDDRLVDVGVHVCRREMVEEGANVAAVEQLHRLEYHRRRPTVGVEILIASVSSREKLEGRRGGYQFAGATSQQPRHESLATHIRQRRPARHEVIPS